MAMKHAHNIDECNSSECYSPQRSIGYISVGNHVRTFQHGGHKAEVAISQSAALSRTV